MRRQIQSAVWIAAILVLIPPQLAAQGTVGRVILTVQDTGGNPIQGVSVSATCEQLPQFKQNAVTNKRGKVTVAFGDSTKVYKLKIEYEGHMTIEFPFKPEMRKALTETVTLLPLSGMPAQSEEGGSEGKRTFTAA